MAGRIKIDTEKCKGCGLCITVCPKAGITSAKKANRSGYLPVEFSGTSCSGCALCAVICPDAAIEVMREASQTGPDPIETVATSRAGANKDKLTS
jgi:2-oxoglutarate ferredoxin oxidoreductase subunit delta